MKRAGQIVLTPFPYTDLSATKLRPVLMLRQASRFDDWLVCMVSSQSHQTNTDLDEIISPTDTDFANSGLKVSSVLRLSRLAVLDGSLLLVLQIINCETLSETYLHPRRADEPKALSAEWESYGGRRYAFPPYRF